MMTYDEATELVSQISYKPGWYLELVKHKREDAATLTCVARYLNVVTMGDDEFLMTQELTNVEEMEPEQLFEHVFVLIMLVEREIATSWYRRHQVRIFARETDGSEPAEAAS